jgi:hypothetical protein
VRSIVVDLEHTASTQSARLVFDAEHPEQTWRVLIRDAPREYRRKVTWLATDGRRIEEPWQTSTSGRVRLNMPAALGANAVRSVQLVAAGDYSAVAQILVELRLAGAAAAVPTELALSAAGQTSRWDVTIDPSSLFKYEVRRTIIRPDGTRQTGTWQEKDVPVLLVQDDARHEVEIVTRLLHFDTEVPLMLLALEPLDGNGDGPKTLQLRDTAGAKWSFSLVNPDQHRYRYQLTLVHRDGHRSTQPWEIADEDVLVLRPPA